VAVFPTTAGKESTNVHSSYQRLTVRKCLFDPSRVVHQDIHVQVVDNYLLGVIAVVMLGVEQTRLFLLLVDHFGMSCFGTKVLFSFVRRRATKCVCNMTRS
jgi:hypothetical protein